jgi:hypothetical protein
VQGRFLTQDPIGFLSGINAYAYVGNSPINSNDPFGLWSKEQCAAARELLRREAKFGTKAAAGMSGIGYGDSTIGPFNSSSSDVYNIPSKFGPVQIDWFNDIMAYSPSRRSAPVVYTFGKVYWTILRFFKGLRIGYPWPFQDGAETNAAVAALNGLTFKDLFSDELMKKECCGK